MPPKLLRGHRKKEIHGRGRICKTNSINYNVWSFQKVCEALTFLLDNIDIRFGSKLYRQIVGIPMGTNCAPLEGDLFFVLL